MLKAPSPTNPQEKFGIVFSVAFDREDVAEAIASAGENADTEIVSAFIAENQREFYNIENSLMNEGNQELLRIVKHWLEYKKGKT